MSARNKHSITIARHRTSVSLEEPLWEALGELARSNGSSVAALVEEIDRTRGTESLSAAVRLYVLERVRRTRKTV